MSHNTMNWVKVPSIKIITPEGKKFIEDYYKELFGDEHLE